jgi:hypothetical protein
MSCRGENRPTVQSAFDGTYYVRSVPSTDYGTEGKTQVFKVRSNGDELVDEYPVYMRENFTWAGIQLEENGASSIWSQNE